MAEEDLKKRVEDLETAVETIGEAMHSNPVSLKCDIILKEALTKARCFDFRGIRQYVMCKTWSIVEKEKIPFRDAIKKSWETAKKECAAASAHI